MKKLLAILITTAIATTATFAQSAKREERIQAREQQQKVFEQKLTAAVAGKNFSFIAQNMQTRFGPLVPVLGIQNYLGVYPNYLDLDVPYVTYTAGVPSPQYINFSNNQYTYEYNIANGKAFVKIFVNNVPNNEDWIIPRNGNYTIHLEIFMTTGSATMTVVPNFNSQITYFGTVQFN